MAKKRLKVKKFAGGGMDASQADFKTPSAKGPVAPTGGRNTSPSGAKNIATNIAQNVKKQTKRVALMPISPFGITVGALKGIENARRAKRAKGEFPLSKKTVDPINREFYRTEGRKLDTKIGGLDEDYLKASGIIGSVKPTIPTNDTNPITCPVGYINQGGVCVKIEGASKGGFTSKYYKGLL